MNSQEYIDSGILEFYVMGSLPEADMEKVRDMAARFPEIAEEIRKIEIILESYAQANAIEPAPDLKEKVLNKVGQLSRVFNKKEPLSGKNNIRSLSPDEGSGSFYKYLAAAAIALLITSSAFNYFVWEKLKKTKQELATLNNEKQEYANQLLLVKSSYDQTLAEINVLQNKDYQSIEMKGLPVFPNTIARVYWNRQTSETFVDIGNLPAPPAGKQYQLWALLDGKPVDAGVFNPGIPLQKVKNVTNAQAFAITLEPVGGSSSPTMASMYVMGNV
jgi:anti-sigma-K factor RskA